MNANPPPPQFGRVALRGGLVTAETGVGTDHRVVEPAAHRIGQDGDGLDPLVAIAAIGHLDLLDLRVSNGDYSNS